MKKKLFIGVLVIVTTMMFAGCNIFSSFAPDDAESQGMDGLVALQDGDYDKAIELYLKVLEEEPNNADAHWGLAKAYLRQSGYTTISIMAEIASFQSSGALLPFMDDPVDSANALYEGVIKTNEHLLAIYSGEATNPELYDETIALDYTGSLALQAILLFRDTNGDGHIDGNDFDLNAQFNLWGEFEMDSDTWNNNITPAQQDSMYAMLEDLLVNSGDVLEFFLNSLLEDLDEEEFDVGFDTDNLDAVIEAILYGFEDFISRQGPGSDKMIKQSDRNEFSRGGQEL